MISALFSAFTMLLVQEDKCLDDTTGCMVDRTCQIRSFFLNMCKSNSIIVKFSQDENDSMMMITKLMIVIRLCSTWQSVYIGEKVPDSMYACNLQSAISCSQIHSIRSSLYEDEQKEKSICGKHKVQ